VDHERGEQVVVEVGGVTATLGPTDAYGWFEGDVVVPASVVVDGPGLPVRAPACDGGPGLAETVAWRLDTPSIAVVSDIDDTIKISEVTDKAALLRRTFLEPFEDAPGMAELYRGWAEQGASFHFVSSSPWQLLGPLRELLRTRGFPEGSFHLKRLRLTDSSLLELWADPMATKPPPVRALIEAAPELDFVLVGDSGEHDPEVYGAIAREYPGRIAGIYIRDVTSETALHPRYLSAFRELDEGLWHLFTDPAGLPPLPVPPPPPAPCTRCHVLPPPDLMPRADWPGLIARKAALIRDYALGPELTREEIVAANVWYAHHAPEQQEVPETGETPSPVAFGAFAIGDPPRGEAPQDLAILSHLSRTDLDGDGRPDVVVSDMKRQRLTWLHQDAEGAWIETLLGEAPAPTRTEVVDLDGDGDLDVVLADLGTLAPTDDPVGLVVLYERDGAQWERRVLAEGLPKSCDVRASDLDGDGDLDLVVAAFGMFATGGVGWLENTDGAFTWHWLLEQNGASHAPVTDLDGDGRPDVIAMISQQHERLVALMNRGEGRFEPHVLFAGPHPMYGMSNLELADLDSDGDVDLLFTTGDALDNDPFPKPWHGVQWAENQGDLTFTLREIGPLYDASAVAGGDLDGDGDVDVVVASMANLLDDPLRQSLVWFENDGQQGFVRHPLADRPTGLIAVSIGDLDADGRQDVLAGAMNVVPPFVRTGRLAAWTNLGPTPDP